MATRRSRKQSVRKRAKTQQNTENRMMDSKIRKEVALIFICLFSFLLFFLTKIIVSLGMKFQTILLKMKKKY